MTGLMNLHATEHIASHNDKDNGVRTSVRLVNGFSESDEEESGFSVSAETERLTSGPH